jgi:hypothetical protein
VKNPIEYHNRTTASPTERAIALYTLGTVGLTTFVIMVALAPFRCYKQMDGSYTLVPSANLNCYDKKWFSNIFIVILGILEVFMLPVGLFWVYFHFRNSLQDNSFVWKFGHLTKKYKDEFYWWEGVHLLKKVIFVMVIDLTNDFDRHIRVLLGVSVLLTVVFLEFLFQPTKNHTGVSRLL